MPHYCQYSFKELFVVAFGREWTEQENQELSAMTQETRNIRVRELAEKANWRVQDVVGRDGITYTAFWPKAGAKTG